MNDENWEWLDPRNSVAGLLKLSDQGLEIEPEDDYYTGVLPPDEAVRLARAILARFPEAGARNPMADPRAPCCPVCD